MTNYVRTKCENHIQLTWILFSELILFNMSSNAGTKLEAYDYAITITLRPQMYRLDVNTQHEIAMKIIVDTFRPWICKRTVIAELTKSYNVHYHGIISSKSKCPHFKKWIFDQFRQDKTIGFLCIKPVTDYNVWATYITKDYVETGKYVRNFVLFDDYKVLNDDYKFTEYHGTPLSGGASPHLMRNEASKSLKPATPLGVTADRGKAPKVLNPDRYAPIAYSEDYFKDI